MRGVLAGIQLPVCLFSVEKSSRAMRRQQRVTHCAQLRISTLEQDLTPLAGGAREWGGCPSPLADACVCRCGRGRRRSRSPFASSRLACGRSWSREIHPAMRLVRRRSVLPRGGQTRRRTSWSSLGRCFCLGRSDRSSRMEHSGRHEELSLSSTRSTAMVARAHGLAVFDELLCEAAGSPVQTLRGERRSALSRRNTLCPRLIEEVGDRQRACGGEVHPRDCPHPG